MCCALKAAWGGNSFILWRIWQVSISLAFSLCCCPCCCGSSSSSCGSLAVTFVQTFVPCWGSKGHSWDTVPCPCWWAAGDGQQSCWNWGSAKKSHSMNVIWPSFTSCTVTRRDGHGRLPVSLLHRDAKERESAPGADVLGLGC